MDLNQLQAELSRLGVTLSSNSDPANIAAALPGQRQYRASLYLAQLQAAETFFTTTLAQPLPIGLGAGYAFVQTALQSPELLNSLALSLDLWVGPAVQQHIEANNFANYAAYQNYFNNNILNLVNATYNVNVAAFYVQYPITANAVQRITANFQANIREACERIIADRVNIQNLFIDQFPGLTLDSLKAIKSTGSDFHKGGKQVLILTFATSWWWGYIPWWSDLKVVYKPTDLEVDCLLVGNTAAVNNAIGGPAFQAHSLAEIFNARGAANPPAGFEALPTYRILPRNPTSALPMGPGGLPVRNAYGYIEHLGYDLTGSQVPYTNLYLYGASDFLIFQYQNEVPIITDFYHRMGQWMALATVFSITDLHLENVRVTKYMPNLIDLEISLTEAFAFDVTATTLFINALGAILGGINGVFNNQEEYVRFARVTGGGGGAHLDLDNVYLHKEFENRLWAMRPAKRLVPVNAFLLIEGLRNGMSVIRDCQQHGVFAPWFARLNNVLVRVLPYGTTTWRRMRKDIYENEVMQAPPPVALWPTILQGLQGQLDNEFGNYVPAADPDFIVLEPGTALVPGPAAADLANFDIPAFYHRIGSTDILDSHGQVIPVPAQVTVHGALVNTNVGRATFYAAAPTGQNVQVAQVQHAGGIGAIAFGNLVTQMVNDTVGPNALNVGVVPAAVGALI